MFEPVVPSEAMLSVQNRIVMAANRYPDGTIIVGLRHFDTIMHGILNLLPHLKEVKAEQGFLDRNWQFQTRRDAWKIAFASGQIAKDLPGQIGILYSEHLY